MWPNKISIRFNQTGVMLWYVVIKDKSHGINNNNV